MEMPKPRTKRPLGNQPCPACGNSNHSHDELSDLVRSDDDDRSNNNDNSTCRHAYPAAELVCDVCRKWATDKAPNVAGVSEVWPRKRQ